MTYVSKKEKVFDLPEQEETSSISLFNPETKLKRLTSVSDRRAWTAEESQRYQHFYGLVNGSESNISKSSSFKYIPFDVLLAILMAEKDAIIQELLERQEDNRCSGDKTRVLYKSDGFEDSDDDRDALIRKDAEVVSLKNKIAGLESELEDCRETLTKAMHKLESMDAILSENTLLKEKIKYSEETIKCLEASKAQLEKEVAYYRNICDVPVNFPRETQHLETGHPWDGGDSNQIIRLSSERDILIQQVQELQQKLEEAKTKEAEIEVLRKISETTSSSLDEMYKENECYKKKLESMKCLEKHIEELKKQAQTLTDKYKRESQKANDQQKQINLNTKELQLLREERDKLQIRVTELITYENQYLSLQSKLHQVEFIIDENEILNKKLMQLDRLELENAELRRRLDYLKCAEVQAVEDKEKIWELQYAAVSQEEEMRKMLRHIEGMSESYSERSELKRLRDELEEKNRKVKKYEKQLKDIPVLESEIDLLKNKLQKCIDDFKADKDLLRRLQEELEACRNRCRELEEMAPLCQSLPVPEGKKENEEKSTTEIEGVAGKPEKAEPEYSELGVNTMGVQKQETECQSSNPEVENKSTLIIDETSSKLKLVEEQNQILKSEVASLTQKLSEFDLNALLVQINDLKNMLDSKNQEIFGLESEVSSIRREVTRYETLKRSLIEEVDLLKEKTGFMRQELSVKQGYIYELQNSLELERKGREFARDAVKTLERKLKNEKQKVQVVELVVKLFKDEANRSKQEMHQHFRGKLNHLKGIVDLSRILNRELETENALLREMKDCLEKKENKSLRTLISILRSEVRALKSLSRPELERECEALKEQIKNLFKETNSLIEEIKDLKVALDSEKSVKDFLEKEVINLQAELTACVTSGNEVLGREISEKEAIIRELREEQTRMKTELESFVSESQTLKDKNGRLEKSVNGLESEQKELKNQINQLRARENELNQSIKDLQEKSSKELEEKTKECLEKTRKLEETCAAVENLKKQLSAAEELREQIKNLEVALKVAEESLSAKEKEMEEAMQAKEESLRNKETELELTKKMSSDVTHELNKLTSEMDILKARLEEKNISVQVADIQGYEADLEEKLAVEDALRKIENELDDLKVKLEECKKMEEEMATLRRKRDSLLEKMSGFENEIENLKKKLLDFESLKNELNLLRAEKTTPSEDLEVSKLYQEVLQQKTVISDLMRDNGNLKADLLKAEGLLEVYKQLQVKIPENPAAGTLEFYTPPTLLSPRSGDVQECPVEMISMEEHKKEMRELEEHYEKQMQRLKEMSGEKLKKLIEQHEKESKTRTKAFFESINSIKFSYESDIRKLVEKHKMSIMRLQGLHEDEVQELNTTYETQMEAMQTQNENLINDLRTESAEKLKQLREQHNREMRELAKKYEEMTKGDAGFLPESKDAVDENLQGKADKQKIEDLTHYYQKTLLEMEEKHNQEIKKCKKNNLKRLDLMKNKYEALLVEERKKYEEQLEEMLLRLKNGKGEPLRSGQEQYVQSKVSPTNVRLEFHEVLQKILNEGLECLTFEELILVHSKTCFMPEDSFEENTGGGEYSQKFAGGCQHKALMTAEKEELLKRIFTLEHEMVIKQLETHEAIVNMEAAEICRVQELKNALCTAQQKNAELKRLLSDQSKQEMNLKIDRYMSDKQATFHETNVVEKVKELEKERAEKKRLQEELQKERATVKNLTVAIEAEKERQHIIRKRETEYVESMRKRLEEALNHEQMMEAQLDYEMKLRARLEAELKNFPEGLNFNSKTFPPSHPLKTDIMAAKNKKYLDQNEDAKEVKHSRSRSRRKSRLKATRLSTARTALGWAQRVKAPGRIMECKKNSSHKMDSWLLDVKRMKIPRPKFSGKYPMEPPKDYSSEDLSKDDKRTAAGFLAGRNIVKATEDLRRELQEKL